MRRPHPSNDLFLTAHRRFLAGELHTSQAIGMVANDPDFIAEASLGISCDPVEVRRAASEIVRKAWMFELVKAQTA